MLAPRVVAGLVFASLLPGCGRVNYAASDGAPGIDSGPTATPDALLVSDAGTPADALDSSSPPDAWSETDAWSATDALSPPDAWSALDAAADSGPMPFICGSSDAFDDDGNEYKTVSIGAQCWLASGLVVGVRIPGTTPQTDNGVIERYCYDDAASCANGALYQWDEAMQYVTTPGARGICPAGWHIPTDLDWQALERHLGMSESDIAAFDFRGSTEGTALKLGGSSSFDAVLTGARADTGVYFGVGTDLFMWSSDPALAGANGISRRLSETQTGVERYGYVQTNAFAIRCLRD